jgi:hypothetical protein
MIKKGQFDLLYKALGLGLNAKDSCIYADISGDTYYKRIKKNPAFAKAVEKATLQPKMRALANIQKAAAVSWQASAWLLERKFSDEFALKNKTEITGKDGSPLVIERVSYAKS